jgi:fatty acid desaturase
MTAASLTSGADAGPADERAALPPRRLPARAFLTETQLSEVRTRNPWRGLGMIAHAWLVIGAAMAVAVIWPNPLTILAAIAVIGSRQLGLAILMHEGAHGLITRDERVNHAVSQWLCAYPVLAETRAYRRYHLKHHAHTQTEDDPDLVLSAPFPITEASYRRKFWRDLSGRTGFEQRKAQIANALGPAGAPIAERLIHLWRQMGPAFIWHGVFFVATTLVAGWWVYPLLWLAPLLTWFQVVTRIRNIAEHAVVPDSSDPLRNTRTTIANRLERLLVAPYYVNYHLEHHLLFYVPAYNLPRVHALLMAGPLKNRVEVEYGYRAVLRRATAKPEAEDRPGAIVSSARRARAGDAMTGNQVRGGF